MFGKIKITRLLIFVIFSGIFSFFAWHLIQAQNNKFDFLSFRLDDAKMSVWIPDMDRLKDKINSFEELDWNGENSDISSSIAKLLENPEFSINDNLASSCFISYTDTDFVFVIQNSDITAETFAILLRDHFSLQTKSTNSSLTIEEREFIFSRFSTYAVLSSSEFEPKEMNEKYEFGHADFTIFTDQDTIGTKHILAGNNHFQVWESFNKIFKGNPVEHRSFIERVPAEVQELAFYGSSRLNDDANTLFSNDTLAEESYYWANSGLIYLRKDSFEIILAPENTERDLSLILEEQTYLVESDSHQISPFNISSYEISPFSTIFSWQSTIKELDSDLHYFAQYLNFNVLSNSIPAMRWYFGEVQLGNMFLNNNELLHLYENTIPEKAHQLHYSNLDGMSDYHLTSTVGTDYKSSMNTEIYVSFNNTTENDDILMQDFSIEILPDNILVIDNSDLILLNNRNQIVLYDGEGNKLWRLNLTSNLNANPRIVDLENDGIQEFVFFQKNQVDVIDIHGQSINGFPKNLDGLSKGGVAVNYDLAYNYRFLVNSGKKILSIDESGNYVDGWEFQEMETNLKSEILYYVTKGKDIISFTDNSGKEYVLNRRGATRVESEVIFNMENVGGFLLGDLDNMTLHKIAYSDQYIYNYYLIDGNVDSVKLDDEVDPIQVSWNYNKGYALLIIEEKGRIAVFDEYGYKKDEILKPGLGNYFGGVIGTQDFRYVFVNNAQNNLYLLNSFGKMLFTNPLKGSNVYKINNGLLYTIVASKLKIYQID